MVIDFHTHTFPDKIAAATIDKLKQASHSLPFTGGTAVQLKESMREAGIQYSVLLPVVTNPLKASPINDISIDMTGKDGLIWFGGIHPDTPDWHEELGRIAEKGLKGIKIHPVYQNCDIDDIRFLRILERAGELDLMVTVHAGNDIGFPGVVRCSPAMARNALRQVGNVKLILAHMGGWKVWDQVKEHLSDQKVFLDTSFSLGEIPELGDGYYTPETKKLLSEEEFCELVHIFGSEHVLFGTDSPWGPQKENKDAILALPLTDEEKRNILGENARRLLNI
ncbi:MAG: amidohydrolase family protein [Firmicutes bacterium]|nr:amidohydrolase family protein [Bacillota bacterium]